MQKPRTAPVTLTPVSPCMCRSISSDGINPALIPTTPAAHTRWRPAYELPQIETEIIRRANQNKETFDERAGARSKRFKRLALKATIAAPSVKPTKPSLMSAMKTATRDTRTPPTSFNKPVVTSPPETADRRWPSKPPPLLSALMSSRNPRDPNTSTSSNTATTWDP